MTQRADLVVGFTGTREGMTESQRATVQEILDKFPPSAAHHGDCVGADEDFHALVAGKTTVVVHPPDQRKLRAFCRGDFTRPELPYLRRNREIVSESDLLIATPKEDGERYKGGTWYTVHYARKQGKRTIVVWPDGSALTDGLAPGSGVSPAEAGNPASDGGESGPGSAGGRPDFPTPPIQQSAQRDGGGA